MAHVEELRRLPVWAFHGAKDPVVPLSESERMIGALRTRSGNLNAKLTVYPEALHDSWTETYENPGFYEWLLKQRRE
jgi:predicted peptidase